MMSAFYFFLPSILVFLSTTTLQHAFACQVTLNDQDVTNEFYIIDSISKEPYVDCMGHSKCRDALIVDCPIIKCFDNEACNSAKIVNFTDSVLCEGLHACHRTEISAAASDIVQSTTVSCIGSGSCDVAQIVGVDEVNFSGVKAGRKVHVQGSKLVKCHDGHDRSFACEGFATLETECLYCGKDGCADHINMCRFEIIGEEDSDNDNDTKDHHYEKCQPEQVVGNCSADIEKELHLELSGKEELDVKREGGTRRMRGFRT